MANESTAVSAGAGVYTEIPALLRLRFSAGDLRLAVKKKKNQANLSGGARARFRGRGMEFEEVRVYQPGDDIRTIDWRVTARTQTPHTKLYREERERPTFIAVDQRANLFFGSRRCFKSVLAAHLGTAVAWAALNNGDRVGGLVFGNDDHRDIRPRRSKHAVLELIHQLNDYNHALHSPLVRERHVALATLLADVARLAKPGSAVYIVSDFADYRGEACDEPLYQLAKHTDVSLYHVFDPLERQLPSQGLLTVSDGEHRTQIVARNRRVRAAFSARFDERLAALSQRCRGLNIALYSFSTADDEMQSLHQIYSSKKGR